MIFIPPRALYVHVPICRCRCSYCDFHSLPEAAWSPSALEDLVSGTLRRVDELLLRFGAGGKKAVGPQSISTVYVGGGTPTALPAKLLASLLKGLADRVSTPLEWTMEANPESLSEEVLDIAQAAGVNRVSLGVQSLDDRLLASLGRLADAESCFRALRRAASRKGLRLSADLIAGLPRSTSLAAEASTLVEAGADHLSIYDITLEHGTRLEADVASGHFVLPDADAALDELKTAEQRLGELGLRRYEVSNYARPGSECMHNLAYWHMDSYIGAGPGAVSTLVEAPEEGAVAGKAGGSLRIEEGHALAAGAAAVETWLSPEDSAFEVIMMAYRTMYGLDREAFLRRFGFDAQGIIGGSLAAWAPHLLPADAWPEGFRASPRAGFLEVAPGSGLSRSARLDSEGLDLLNRFLVDCLSEIETRFPR